MLLIKNIQHLNQIKVSSPNTFNNFSYTGDIRNYTRDNIENKIIKSDQDILEVKYKNYLLKTKERAII